MAENANNVRKSGPLRLKTGALIKPKSKTKHKSKNSTKNLPKHEIRQNDGDRSHKKANKRSRSLSTTSKASSTSSDTSAGTSHSNGSSDGRDDDENDNEGRTEDVEERLKQIKRHKGTGKLLLSQTTVTGIEGTRFTKELNVGDVIVLQTTSSSAQVLQELRVVKYILSDKALAISSPFTITNNNTSSTTNKDGKAFGWDWEYMKKPEDTGKGSKRRREREKRRKREKEIEERNEVEKGAFGTYSTQLKETGGDKSVEYSYRVRKGGVNTSGGYRIVKEKTQDGKELSREELLDLRCKYKGDRNCM